MARSAALLALALAACAGPRPPQALLPPGTLIAHGLGGIAGVTYSNSREAFELWYGRGRRWFETDLTLTADRQLVCFHPGLEPLLGLEGAVGNATLERFLSWRVAGSYTPLSLRGLLELLRDRPDTFVFVDPGMLTPAIVEGLHATVDAVEPKLRRQLLVEFYAPEQLAMLRESEIRRGRFGAVVFATYQWASAERDVVRLVAAERIPVVVLGSSSASRALVERLRGAGARVVVHTVNDPARARDWLAAGADGLMTDFLSTPAVAN
jgi:glycerophosphoryl diester phosphodiesterase